MYWSLGEIQVDFWHGNMKFFCLQPSSARKDPVKQVCVYVCLFVFENAKYNYFFSALLRNSHIFMPLYIN
jgi:hypothetical protein